MILFFYTLFFASLNVHSETKLTFSGDAYVRAYFKNSTGPNGLQAFDQFFRLNIEAKPEDALSIKSGLILSSNTWEGDNHKGITSGGTSIGGTNDDGFSNDNVTRLDHATIEYSKDNWIVSAGRHAVSTPGNFLTSDDRRDRIQILKIRDNFDLVAFAYDKRAEGSLSNSRDDLDMYSLSYYGTFGTPLYRYAVQTAYWVSKKYNPLTSGINSINLDNVKQISPQLEGKLGAIDFNFYYTLLFGGSAFYKNDHHASALKLSHQFENLKWELQSIFIKNGGFIASGFDTFSSVINNSLDHNQSSIKIKTIGFGLGNNKVDDFLHMVRVTQSFNQKISLSLSGGHGEFFSGAKTPKEKDSLLDISGKYTLSSFLDLHGAYGHFFGDRKDHAGSLTIKAKF